MAVAAGAPGVAVAQSPDSAPATQPASGPATAPAFRPWPMGGNRLLRLRDLSGLVGLERPDDRTGPADAEEWDEISQFAARNFPNRWKAFENVRAQRGANSEVIDRLRSRITARYRLLMRVQREMNVLYDVALEQARVEDDAWAAIVAARQQPANAELRQAMREKVGTLVKNLLRERQDRLEALRQTVKAEQDRLDRDRDDVERLIDRQIERLTGDAPYDPGFPGR
jgi:hypothetical protein